MIRHVVMWRLKSVAENRSREENIKIMKDMLEALPASIAEIVNLRVDVDMLKEKGSFDLMLTVDLADAEALQRYQRHPVHVKVAEFITVVREDRAVVDFQV